MRARLLTLAVVALLFVGCGQSGWSEYSSNEGKFTVLMPGSPDRQTQKVPTPIGPINLYMSMVEKRDIVYMVAYADYPKFVVEKATADEILTGARNGAIAKIEGKLLKEERVSYDEYPGRELEFEAKNGIGLGRAVILLADNRLYQVLAVGEKKGFPRGDAQKFLDSFEVWD